MEPEIEAATAALRKVATLEDSHLALIIVRALGSERAAELAPTLEAVADAMGDEEA